jgi:[acyl-carrier-protein] S-malonyltransferase
LQQNGVTHIVEAGPGKVLAGLNKRIDKTMTAMPVFDPATLDKTQQALGEAE